MNVEFLMGTTVTAVVIVAALIMLVNEYRSRGRRPPTTNYCNHPSYQPKVRALGGAQFACHCPRCHDHAIVTAEDETAARREYLAHPCSPQ